MIFIFHRRITQKDSLDREVSLNKWTREGQAPHGRIDALENTVVDPSVESQNQERRYPTRQIRKPQHLHDYVLEQDKDDDEKIGYYRDYCCVTSVVPRT